MSEPLPKRCGFCAIIGAPNAGKSTLLNTLAGTKISIVSHKVQTTRARIRAIVIEDASQIIFVDTPGIFKPRRKLDEAMVEGAWAGAAEADAVILLVDARQAPGEIEDLIAVLPQIKRDVRLALNKIDLLKRDKLLDIAAAYNAAYPFKATYMISALTGSGVADLKRDVADDRSAVKDDVKLIAQAICESLTHILTEDAQTLVKYLRRLNDAGTCVVKPILLADGFDSAWFDNGQKGLLADE